tara:strand:+ start:2767 stop:4728 length:1962 start_codon:yes stop_codon:yes gene_type:complete
MNKIDINIVKIKLLFLFLLIIIPWMGLQSSSSLEPAIPSQEDLTFYEINPCKVSLMKFLTTNLNTTYQDHYFFRFTNDSPISCFGLISGASLVGTDLYISVGSNSLINLIIQGSFWTILISFLRKDESLKKTIKMHQHFISVSLTALIFCSFVYVESRFYENSFYLFNKTDKRFLIILLIAAFFVIKNLVDISILRINTMIYFIPYTYLIIGVFSGFNFHFLGLLFIYFGLISLTKLEKISKSSTYVFFAFFFWVMNSAFTGDGFYFDPGKLRGFTSSVYSFYSTLLWSLFFILLINGLYYIYKNYLNNFDIDRFTSTFSISAIPIIIAGFLGANFPIINLFNFYYFGQQKHGVTINNPFLFNQWSEKVAWRGFYPSAETIGEYFALILIFIFFIYRKNKSLSRENLIGGLFAFLGLYFSNNRAAFLFLVFVLIYFFTQDLSKKIRLIGFILFSIFFLYLVGFQNLGYDYSFTSNVLSDQANNYQYESIESSFLEVLNNEETQKGVSNSMFKFISAGAYLINRAELWGIFSSRYNPTYFELLLGSGPLNFGQLYGEVIIKPTKGVLLPHSSFLSLILFFGILGVSLILIKIFSRVIINKNSMNASGYLLLIYLFLNLFKNDSLNYFPTFVFYSLLFYIVINISNKRVFKEKRG